MRSERCPRCDSDDCDEPGGFDCEARQRERVKRVVTEMTARGWIRIKHPQYRRAIRIAQAPHEIAPSSTSKNPVDGRLKMSTCMYAPRWVGAILGETINSRRASFEYRHGLLTYAVRHDLGDALMAQLSLEGSVAEYLREHAYAHGQWIDPVDRCRAKLDDLPEKA